jgi:hypothetical protein
MRLVSADQRRDLRRAHLRRRPQQINARSRLASNAALRDNRLRQLPSSGSRSPQTPTGDASPPPRSRCIPLRHRTALSGQSIRDGQLAGRRGARAVHAVAVLGRVRSAFRIGMVGFPAVGREDRALRCHVPSRLCPSSAPRRRSSPTAWRDRRAGHLFPPAARLGADYDRPRVTGVDPWRLSLPMIPVVLSWSRGRSGRHGWHGAAAQPPQALCLSGRDRTAPARATARRRRAALPRARPACPRRSRRAGRP